MSQLSMLPILLCVLLASCTGSNKTVQLGVQNSLLTPCPASPNCVSSDADDPEHQTPAFQLAVPATEAWKVATTQVKNLPRTKVVTTTNSYLHAQCSTAVFGFIDDLELHLRPTEGVIAVRSAARVGHSDFGVNRQRIKDLRAELLKQGTIHSPPR